MVQVDLPAAFAYGQVYAMLSRRYLKKERSLFQSRLLGPLNLFLSVCFAPVGMFLLIGWPAWEVMYSTDWMENPFDRPLVAAFYVLFEISMIFIGNAGYITAHAWYRREKDNLVLIGAITSSFLAILPFALRPGVWWNIGTYSQVQQGAGYSFWDSPFFGGWLVFMSYLAISSILAGIWFKKRGDALSLKEGI